MKKDHMTSLCMNLAMTSTAFSRHRGTLNQANLTSAIDAMLPHLPAANPVMIPNKEEAKCVVRSALACGRSAGLTWHEMRVQFNEAAEQLPPPLPDAMQRLQKSIHGEYVQ